MHQIQLLARTLKTLTIPKCFVKLIKLQLEKKRAPEAPAKKINPRTCTTIHSITDCYLSHINMIFTLLYIRRFQLKLWKKMITKNITGRTYQKIDSPVINFIYSKTFSLYRAAFPGQFQIPVFFLILSLLKINRDAPYINYNYS